MEKTFSSNQQLAILQQALESGIISIDGVHDNIMASKREKTKNLHTFAITPPSEKNPRWQTYYKIADGTRKLIRAQSEEELLDKLIPIYFPEKDIDNLTFYALYEEWLDYKSTITSSPNTIKRHKQHYKKYLEASSLHQKKISRIDEILLEKECNRIVKDFNLPRKEWCNVKTILNGMFEYAVRKKYLPENPMPKVQIHIKFKQVVRKTGKTETFNTTELADINSFLDRMYEETSDSSFLAVKVNFLLGLRVGELVSLKWSDLCDENHLHIVREEIRNQVTNAIEVVEHTKTNRDRFVIVVPKAREIFNRIEKQGDYIFMRDGKRITSIRIASVLRKYARYMGVPLKSSHKLRKTYASNLNAKGVPLDCIREMLGHSSLQTTLSYIYNPLSESETYNLITSAL
ncbi:MAG: tyrosine-type recombinase/integrase [Bacteroides fragilis]